MRTDSPLSLSCHLAVRLQQNNIEELRRIERIEFFCQKQEKVGFSPFIQSVQIWIHVFWCVFSVFLRCLCWIMTESL